jgi:hypothetical protein
MDDEKITPSISVNKELWNEFSSIIAKKRGNRQISAVLEELIIDYIRKNGGHVAVETKGEVNAASKK